VVHSTNVDSQIFQVLLFSPLEKMASAVASALSSLTQTVCIDIRTAYPGGGKVPIPEWCSLLKNDVGLDMTLVEEVCQHSVTGVLIVKVKTEECYQDLLRKVEEGVLWSKVDKKVYGWTAGVEISTVYLHNVLGQADLKGILEVLARQGEVLGYTVHKYRELPHVRNGIVSVRMKLKASSEIQAYIYDEKSDCTIQVFCDKQQKVCYRCLGKGHIAAYCKRPVKTRVTAAATKTWAAVAAGRKDEAPPGREDGTAPPPPPPAEDTVGGTSVVMSKAGKPIVRTLPAESQGEEMIIEDGSTTELDVPQPQGTVEAQAQMEDRVEEVLGTGANSWFTQEQAEEEKKRKNSGPADQGNPEKTAKVRLGASMEQVADVRKKGLMK